MSAVDLRCPVYTRRLFARVLHDGEITAQNTVTVACTDCRKARRQQGERVTLVVHEFNLLGECVQTTVT